ncbi:MAG TPA: hypothetical protein VN765_16865 [Candidatus Acidoferrum sp.]|nr:hypothetical protein [Candidatus Acidoferrum sp.]
MQRFRHCIKRLARPAFTAFLAAALLLLTAAAPSASLHQRLHNGSHATGDGCLLCMMAQGHLDFPSPAPILGIFTPVCIALTPATQTAAVLQVDLRLAPSRAPPIS